MSIENNLMCIEALCLRVNMSNTEREALQNLKDAVLVQSKNNDYTGRINCYHCPENMAKQCELEFGGDGIPPCTKAMIENCRSLQQVKDEIATMLPQWKHCCEMGQDWYEVDASHINRLQQLSANQHYDTP